MIHPPESGRRSSAERHTANEVKVGKIDPGTMLVRRKDTKLSLGKCPHLVFWRELLLAYRCILTDAGRSFDHGSSRSTSARLVMRMFGSTSKAVTLAQELMAAQQDVRLNKYLKSWKKVDLVILDELGYLRS